MYSHLYILEFTVFHRIIQSYIIHISSTFNFEKKRLEQDYKREKHKEAVHFAKISSEISIEPSVIADYENFML